MSKKSNAITLAQLASDLGLTASTVSRALNGYSDIAKSTRDRVQKRATELNYRPSANARRLATGIVNTVGLILPKMSSGISDSFFIRFLEGASEELAKTDRDVLMTSVQDGEDEVSVYRRIWNSKKVDGFIVVRTHTHDPRIDFLLENNIPFVSHGRSAKSDQHSWYDADNEQALITAVDHLVAQGHQKIAYIGGQNHYHFNKLRKQGFEKGLLSNRLNTDQLIYSGPLSETFGYQCINEILKTDKSVTGVICAQDKQALGVYRGLHEHNLIPGRDFSVVGYDNISASEYTNPPLTTLAPQQHHSGSVCAQLFVALLKGKKASQLQEIGCVNLITRHSVAKPPSSTDD